MINSCQNNASDLTLYDYIGFIFIGGGGGIILANALLK